MRTIAILSSIYLCIESAFYRGLYNGHGFGAGLCDKSDYSEQGSFFATHSYTPYNQLTDVNIYICWLLIFFIVGQLIKKENISQIISLPAISFALLGFILVWLLKHSYVSNENDYFDLMRMTLKTDFVHILGASFLFIYQIIMTVQVRFNQKDKMRVL